METKDLIDALAALAHPTRLQAFRLLVAAEPQGVAAGTLAALLAVPPSTLSVHLARLEDAGLVSGRRASRNIFYSAGIDRVRRLTAFLLDECCGGRPDLCGDAVTTVAAERRVA